MNKKSLKTLFSPLKNRLWLINEENTISYKTIKGFTKALCYLPKPIRKRIFYILDSFVILMTRFFSISNQISLFAYIISGKEKHSGEKFTILFIGNKILSPYLSNLMFQTQPEILKNFRIYIWDYKKKINQLHLDVDAVLIKSDRFYSGFFEKKGFTIIPEWIKMTLDVSESWDIIHKNLSKGVKEDLRKIKKFHYDYEVTSESDKLKMFYYKMYLPYLSWRYKDPDMRANFYAIKHLFEQGSELLLIKNDNEYLFGGLFLKKKNKVVTSYAGVIEGRFDCIQQGVMAASYYYLIEHSKKIGIKTIDFGTTRPFIKDGVFCYKKKWGGKIEKADNQSAEIYSFKIRNNNNPVKSFLENNPTILIEKNKLTQGFNNKNFEENLTS